MSWLSSIFSGGASGIIDGVGGLVDRFVTTSDEKNEFKLEVEKLVTARMAMANEQANIEMDAKSKILQAELNQSDNFTKRARPTVVYMGLVFIGLNYCIIPLIQQFAGLTVAPFELPSEFWYGWSGIVATWSVGRSMEKRGVKNNAVTAITGTQSVRSLLD
jgi:hypothetical protein